MFMIGMMKSELLTALNKNFQPTIMVSTLSCTFFRNNCCSVTVMSNSLQQCGLWHGRLPCPPLSPEVCSSLCPFSSKEQASFNLIASEPSTVISEPQMTSVSKCRDFQGLCRQMGDPLVGMSGLTFCLPLLCQAYCHLSISSPASAVLLASLTGWPFQFCCFFQFLEVCFSFVLHYNFSRSSEETEVNLIQFDVFNQKLQFQPKIGRLNHRLCSQHFIAE